MPGIYKLFTAIVAIIGNVSLIATGEMNPVFSFIGTGLLWGYYRSMKGLHSLPKWAVGSLSLITFALFLGNFYLSGDVFISVAQMTLIFQVIKSFDMRVPWDPLQVFFVSLLQILMASELINSISFGIIFLVFLVFIVVSILLGHFIREGQMVFRPYLRPIAVITFLTLIFTGIFFVSVPRFRSGLWGRSFSKSIKTTGFSDKVDFGSFGEVKLDETVIMRMILDPDVPGSHYLRGMTFNYFDNFAWYDTLKDTRRIFRTSEDFKIKVLEENKKFEAEIFLEPIDSSVIFTFKKPYKIESAGFFMRRDTAGSFYMRQKISKRFNYKLFSIDGYTRDNLHIENYLQFPEEIPAVKNLAEEITVNEEDTFIKAEIIRDYLLKNYKYSLYTEEPEYNTTAIEDFLFRTREGYCEHFATAMTLMVRSIGIPARLVTGFLSGQKNDFGDYYLIRQSDAHSWVEVFLDDRWITFDPTPPVDPAKRLSLVLFLDMMRMNWNRYVVGFSSYDQKSLANYMFRYRRNIMKMPDIHYKRFAAVAVVLMISALLYRLKQTGVIHKKHSAVSAEYIRFRKRVLKYGGKISRSSTTKEVVLEAVDTGRFSPADIKEFIGAYRELRFSGQTDSGLLRSFQKISRKLENS